MQATTRTRLAGVDMARALAIVGMVAVHFAPRPNTADDAATWWLGVPYGKASILFALVAGIGVSLMSARKPASAHARLVYRTLWLLPVGLGLQALEHPVAVILQYYAIWFLVAAPFVGRRDRTLLVTSLVWLPLGSLAVAWVGINHPEWVLFRRGDSPGGVPMDILLTGYYPTVTWMPVVLFGMWLGRRDLTSRRVRGWLVAAGAGLALVAYRVGPWIEPLPDQDDWSILWSVRGHSEMPLAIIGSTALVGALLGVCLWLGDRLPRTTRPLAAFGEGALTVYVGHLLIWHVTDGRWFSPATSAETWVTILWFTIVSTVFMAAWLAVLPRGPLETVVRWPFQHVAEPLILMARGPSIPEPSPDEADVPTAGWPGT